MGFPFDEDETADPNQPVDPVRPFPDLRAGFNFRFRLDPNARKVYVSGYVRNVGNVDVDQPFMVVLGVTLTVQDPPRPDYVYSAERRSTIASLAVGEEVMTEETSAPLFYEDQGNAKYDIELIVDATNVVTELKSSNNRTSLEWSFFRTSTMNEERVLVNTLPPE